MKTIMTVLGPIAAADLGYCQMHEHIFVLPTPNSVKYPALEISDEAASLRELIAYRKSRGEAMLDAQPIGAGRDIAVLKRAHHRHHRLSPACFLRGGSLDSYRNRGAAR